MNSPLTLTAGIDNCQHNHTNQLLLQWWPQPCAPTTTSPINQPYTLPSSAHHTEAVQSVVSKMSHYGIASRCSHSGVMCVSYESHGLWKQQCKGYGQQFAICTTTHVQKCDICTTTILLYRHALHCQSSHSKHNGFICWHWRFGHTCIA